MHYSSYARLLLLGAIWGFSFLFMRMVAPVLGAVPTAFFRVLFASLGLIVILMVLCTRWQFQGKFRQTLLLGAIMRIPANVTDDSGDRDRCWCCAM